MCQVGIGPSIAYYETEEIVRATIDLAEKLDIKVHGHLAESRGEVAFVEEHYGCRSAVTTCWATASTMPTASTLTMRRYS